MMRFLLPSIVPLTALLLTAALLTTTNCHADEPSFALTTDTPAYCAQLVKQVAARHSTSLDVQRLLSEGQELCERGQIRGGIRRLRHAFVLLHQRVGKEDGQP